MNIHLKDSSCDAQLISAGHPSLSSQAISPSVRNFCFVGIIENCFKVQVIGVEFMDNVLSTIQLIIDTSNLFADTDIFILKISIKVFHCFY